MAWPPAMVSVLAPLARYALPDAAGAALQHGLDRGAQVGREHLTDVAVCDQVARVQIAGSLRACRPTMVFSERCFARPAISCASARFAPSGHSQNTGLSGLQAGHDQVLVPGHPHADDDEVDVRVRRHVVDVVEGELGAELRLRGLRGLLVRGADRLQLVVGQGLQGGDVGVGAPAAAALWSRSRPRCRRESCLSSESPALFSEPVRRGRSSRRDAVGGLVQIGHVAGRGAPAAATS